jgi:prefoldin subunit 5
MSKDLPSIDDFAEDNSNLPSIDDFITEENAEELPSVEDFIEKEEVITEATQTIEDANGESFAEVKDIVPPWPELVKMVNDVRADIPDIPEIKYYDKELEDLAEQISQIRDEIPEVPEVRYYEKEVEAICEQIDLVREQIKDLPEVKYYDEQVNAIEDRIDTLQTEVTNLPEVKYYDREIEAICSAIDQVRSEIPTFPKWVNEVNEVPDFSWIGKTFSVIDDDFIKVNDTIDTLKENVQIDIKKLIEDNEVRHFENRVQFGTEVKDLDTKLGEEKEKIWKELRDSSMKIWEYHKEFKDDDKKLKKQILGEYNSLKQNIKKELKEVSKESVKTDELLLKYFTELRKEVSEIVIPEIKDYDDDLRFIRADIKDLRKLVRTIKTEQKNLSEGLLNEPPSNKESVGGKGDPLTPMDQNFATLDDLASHYRLFINRIQQQISTIGGGGAGFIKDLDDVDISGLADNYILQYDATNSKWLTVANNAGAGGTWASNSIGISTTKNVGIATTSAKSDVSLFVVGDIEATGNVNVAGTITYEDVKNVDSLGLGTFRSGLEVRTGTATTALLVQGDARVTGILTIGTASVTIDGDNNKVSVGVVTITNSEVILGDNVTINSSATGINSAPNVLYVAKDGSDDNNGTSIDNAKLTIAGAVSIAQSGTTIKVLSGNYVESNPIELPAFTAVVGDDLRTVKVLPNTPTSDIFHVNKACKVANITFSGHTAPAAAIAFPSGGATNVGGGKWKGPYIQNCTSDTTTGTGIYIDGDKAVKTKSMNVDAFTQYNQGGVGVAVTNEGYAQLVSVFTICCDKAIQVHKGGQADLANSNCSFGTFGLVADGVSPEQFTGIVTASAAAAQDNITINVGAVTTRPYDGQVVYFDQLYKSVETITVGSGGTGYTQAPTVTVDSPSGPNGETASAFATIENGAVTEISIISSGSQYTSTPSVTISGPQSGINTATATANMADTYFTINSATPIVSGITTLTLAENLINTVGVGSTAYFFQQSKIVASSHTFEYIGSGNTITLATPKRGGVTIQANEVVSQNGGRVIYTSTDQAGNFRIGDDLQINQATGTISGRAFSKSLFSEITPFILALG